MATLTATPLTGNSPPAVSLELVWSGPTSVTVERLEADGRWHPVRGGEPGTLSGGAWTGFDYEVPYGQSVTYRATSTTDASAPTSTVVVLAASHAWLVHPGVPGLSCELLVKSAGERVRAARRGIFEPVGRATPIVVSSVRSRAQWPLTVLTRSAVDRRELDDLLDDGSPLLLNVDTGNGWGIDPCYVSVGDVTEARRMEYLAEQDRWWSLPLVEVDRPAGGLTRQWTVDALVVEQATIDSVVAAYATVSDLAAHRSVA